VISGYNLTFDVVHLQHCGVKDGVLYHGTRTIITEYIDTLQDMILMKLGLLTSEDIKDEKKV
jgi:acetylglutamate kinase